MGAVENPGPASFQSGTGLLSGWVCEADVVEFDRAMFTVTTLGEEFVTDATGETVVADFPTEGEQERTRAGLAAARARGRLGGRPSLDLHNPRVQMAKALYQDQAYEVRAICQTLHIISPARPRTAIWHCRMDRR